MDSITFHQLSNWLIREVAMIKRLDTKVSSDYLANYAYLQRFGKGYKGKPNYGYKGKSFGNQLYLVKVPWSKNSQAN